MYPGEQENVEYMNYKLHMEENGQPALPKDQWRKMNQPTPVTPESVKDVTEALMRQRK